MTVVARLRRQWQLLGALIRRSSLFAVVPAVQAVSLFVVISALAAMSTPAELGEIATAQLVMQLAVLVAAGGLPGLVTSEFFVGEDGPSRAKRLIGFASLVVAPSTLLLVFATGPLWSGIFENLSFSTSIKLGIVAAWPRSFVVSCLGVLRAERSAGHFALLALTSLVGSQIIGVAAVLVWGDPAAFMSGLLVGNLFAAVLGHVLVRPELRAWRPSREVVAALAVSIPIAVNSGAGLVVTTGDRVVIERMLGLAEVGRYQIAYLLGSVGVVVLLALNNAWAPAVYARSGDAQRAVLAATTRSLLVLAATMSIALASMGPIALRLLAPAEYELLDLTGLVALISLAAIPYVFYLAATHRAMVSRSTGRMAIATVLAATVNIAGNLVLVPSSGLTGAGVATVASYVVWAVVVQRRREDPSGGETADEGVLTSVLGHLVGTVVIVVAFGFAIPADGWWLVLRAAFGALFVAGGLEITRRLLVSSRATGPGAEEALPSAIDGLAR